MEKIPEKLSLQKQRDLIWFFEEAVILEREMGKVALGMNHLERLAWRLMDTEEVKIKRIKNKLGRMGNNLNRLVEELDLIIAEIEDRFGLERKEEELDESNTKGY